ncbi:MAG TPA: DUF4293 domain-containing protein [Cytophagaceae bacterium]|jgi:hypothetical protein|nr:DUF4293 domain-containing protein [Cytophagaceae bacterium]
MIQRVQSLLLFFSALLMLIFLFVPIWQGSNKAANNEGKIFEGKVSLKAFKLTLEGVEKTTVKTEFNSNVSEIKIDEKFNVVYIVIPAIISIIISAFSIFQFKNRILQMKLGMFNTLIIIGVLGGVFLGIRKGKSLLPVIENDDFMIGFLLPVIALILNVMANRFIRNDEKLVKSADRFR